MSHDFFFRRKFRHPDFFVFSIVRVSFSGTMKKLSFENFELEQKKSEKNSPIHHFLKFRPNLRFPVYLSLLFFQAVSP